MVAVYAANEAYSGLLTTTLLKSALVSETLIHSVLLSLAVAGQLHRTGVSEPAFHRQHSLMTKYPIFQYNSLHAILPVPHRMVSLTVLF